MKTGARSAFLSAERQGYFVRQRGQRSRLDVQPLPANRVSHGPGLSFIADSSSAAIVLRIVYAT